eukprot:SAG11_NODE_2798_length_2958_cov_2.445261_3_plen_45_part_00
MNDVDSWRPGDEAAVRGGIREEAIGRDEPYSFATTVLADRDREL